jgi:catechol 2,3-dioxygenase-like lactoylglutathione lyase family enzyme
MTPTLNAFGIVVADMGKALAFYRSLGLQIPAEADAGPHAEAPLPGGLRLMFDTHETVRSFDPQWQPPTGGFRMGLAFQCGSPSEVDSTYAAMTGAGHTGHHEPWDAFWGQRYATLHDPDGNPVDLYAPLA